jgi:hypothetical protein
MPGRRRVEKLKVLLHLRHVPMLDAGRASPFRLIPPSNLPPPSK